ncbi:hypothetical protein F5B19DRAFT_418551 [Rostrohypoxylon terebratum]|nr:hypothetical protein F5B19DRAFT_418551 [Rostrohypoxylon terebratum]
MMLLHYYITALQLLLLLLQQQLLLIFFQTLRRICVDVGVGILHFFLHVTSIYIASKRGETSHDWAFLVYLMVVWRGNESVLKGRL